MHSFLNAKIMAKSLRTALAERSIDITHSDSLELVARQFGFDDWNILAARIEAARETPLPPGWVRHHQGQGIYRMGADVRVPPFLHIDSTPGAVPIAADFGTLMQKCSAAPYRGAALAFTAELAGEAVDTASVWMRVDGKDGSVLAFDNLFTTPGATLSGSFDWSELAVQLPVAAEAESVAYGVILKGNGHLQIRAPRLAPAAGEGVAV